jgi:hypothetical protein
MAAAELPILSKTPPEAHRFTGHPFVRDPSVAIASRDAAIARART